MPVDGSRNIRRFAVLLILAATLLGGLLRFQGLGVRDFWLDESCTFFYVHHLFDWPDGSNLLAESTNLPYYLLLRGWTTVFGDGEAAYRALSALAALLTIPLLAIAAWRVGGPKTGVIASLLAAFHPLHIYYAHEARAYALWMLALTVAMVLLFEAVRRTSRRWWLAYGLVILGCLHLHYFTVFWIAASIAATTLATDKKTAVRQWLITTALVGAAFVPYIVVAVLPAAGAGGQAWIATSWNALLAIPETLWAMMPAGRYPAHLRGLSLAAPDTVAVAPAWVDAWARRMAPALMAAMVALLIMARRRSAKPPSSDAAASGSHLALAGLALGPLAGAWCYSIAVHPIYLSGRYDVVAWPAMILWMALIIERFGRTLSPRVGKAATTAACLCLVLCSAVPIRRMAAIVPRESFHRVRAERLAALVEPNDLVIAFSYDRDYLSYYLHRAGFRNRVVSFPSWLDRQIGWVDTAADRRTAASGQLDEDAAQRLEQIERTIAAGDRVFLLTDYLRVAATDSRNDINLRLLHAARAAGLAPTLVDERVLILELKHANP